jgi:hypothetical protein
MNRAFAELFLSQNKMTDVQSIKQMTDVRMYWGQFFFVRFSKKTMLHFSSFISIV